MRRFSQTRRWLGDRSGCEHCRYGCQAVTARPTSRRYVPAPSSSERILGLGITIAYPKKQGVDFVILKKSRRPWRDTYPGCVRHPVAPVLALVRQRRTRHHCFPTGTRSPGYLGFDSTACAAIEVQFARRSRLLGRRRVPLTCSPPTAWYVAQFLTQSLPDKVATRRRRTIPPSGTTVST